MGHDSSSNYLERNLSRSKRNHTSVNFLVCSPSKIEKLKSDGKKINKELERETDSMALEMLNDLGNL
ncbi:hypothetical protein ACS0TY_004185 [Phlomoides rotata]